MSSSDDFVQHVSSGSSKAEHVSITTGNIGVFLFVYVVLVVGSAEDDPFVRPC